MGDTVVRSERVELPTFWFVVIEERQQQKSNVFVWRLLQTRWSTGSFSYAQR